MNDVIIRIIDSSNNVLGDLELANFNDFPLAINKGIVNLDNLKERTGTFTKTFKVPNTKNNSSLLSNVDNINTKKDFNECLNRKPCSIIVNNSEIEKGFVQVSKVFNGYELESFELVFFGNNIDWVKSASEFKVNSINFANNLQTYGRDQITAANLSNIGTYDHAYPYISRGGNQAVPNTEVRDFLPTFYLTNIIKKGLTALGWNTSSSFIDSTDIKKLMVDLNSEMKVAQSVIDDSKTRAALTTSQTINVSGLGVFAFDDDTNTPNQDNNNNYNASSYRYTVPSSGRYEFTVNLTFGDYTLLGGLSSMPFTVKILENDLNIKAQVTHTVNTTLTEDTKEYKLSTRLDAGEVVRVYYEWNKVLSVGFNVKAGSFFKVQRNSELTEGDPFSLNEMIPDSVKLIDVVNDFTRMFNIYYWTDIKSKTVYFEPRDDFFKSQSDSIDWTEKIDISNKYEIDYVSSYKRNVEFSYKDVSGDAWLEGWEESNRRKYAKYDHKLPDRFAEGTTKIQLDLFGASYAHKATEATGFINNDNVAFTTLKCWNEYILNGQIPNTRIDKYNPRIFFFIRGPQYALDGTQRKIFDLVNGSGSKRFIPYAIFESYNNTDSVQNLSFTDGVKSDGTNDIGLFNRYYSRMMKNIEDGGRLIAYFNLTSSDIENLDFRNLVYLDNDSNIRGYYLIEKVIDYQPINNNLTKVSLFKFENLGKASTDSTQTGNNPIDDDNGNNPPILEPIYIESGNQLISVLSQDPLSPNLLPVFK